MLKQLPSTLFVKLTIGSFRLGETVKSSDSFIHSLNYNLAAADCERI